MILQACIPGFLCFHASYCLQHQLINVGSLVMTNFQELQVVGKNSSYFKHIKFYSICPNYVTFYEIVAKQLDKNLPLKHMVHSTKLTVQNCIYHFLSNVRTECNGHSEDKMSKDKMQQF